MEDTRVIGFDQAAAALAAGQPVVFPTDTVYGLGVAVRFASSAQALYDLKRRSADKPIAWLVDGVEALEEYGKDVPASALELARAHWPGALTIIVKGSDRVPAGFLPPSGAIGMRMPANQTALELMRAVGSPLATTSANLSGTPAPHELDQVSPELLAHVGAVVRDTQARSGVASTVVDCSQGGMTVIRQGDIAVDLREALPRGRNSKTKE